VPFVVVPVHRVFEEGSPELRRRSAPPRRAVCCLRRNRADRTALDEVVVARATSWCDPRMKSSPLARSRGTPARPQPLAAVRRRLLPARRSHATVAARSRSDGPDRFYHHRLSSSCRRPLDQDPTGWIRSNPGQYRSNQHDLAFLQKPPELFLLTKIPSRRRKFIAD
jgi:hypothetical protein